MTLPLGVPVAYKSAHSGRSCPATHHQTLQNSPPSVNTDFRVVDLDSIGHGAQPVAAEGCIAGQHIGAHDFDAGCDPIFRDPGFGPHFCNGAIEAGFGNVASGLRRSTVVVFRPKLLFCDET